MKKRSSSHSISGEWQLLHPVLHLPLCSDYLHKSAKWPGNRMVGFEALCWVKPMQRS